MQRKLAAILSADVAGFSRLMGEDEAATVRALGTCRGLVQDIVSAVIYEDPRLLVINKPAGVAVHGGSGVSFGVIEALRAARPDEELELVHRIERETS